MKNLIKQALTAALIRPATYFAMRSVEINLDGMIKTRERVEDPLTRHAMNQAITLARSEAVRLRNKYIALQPRGSWRVA